MLQFHADSGQHGIEMFLSLGLDPGQHGHSLFIRRQAVISPCAQHGLFESIWQRVRAAFSAQSVIFLAASRDPPLPDLARRALPRTDQWERLDPSAVALGSS
jgi:hypothetical protein